jgi:hypothetical protein
MRGGSHPFVEVECCHARPVLRGAAALTSLLLASLSAGVQAAPGRAATVNGSSPSNGSAVARPRKVIVEPAPPVPDPAARQQASEANLEANGPRHGWTFGVALLAWQQIGSIDDSNRGGGGSFRLGAVATPDTIILVELLTAGFPNFEKDNPSYIVNNNALAVAVQRYVGDTLWVRIGAGFTNYVQVAKKDTIDAPEFLRTPSGFAVVTGFGLDVVRWRSTRLSVEAIQSVHRFSTGWLLDLGFGLGLTYY